jgi:hypothetical protein
MVPPSHTDLQRIHDAEHHDDRCSTDVVVSIEESLQALSSFVCWVPKYAELIRSITLTTGFKPTAGTVDKLPWQSHIKAAQKLVQEALQLPCSSSTTPLAPYGSSGIASTGGFQGLGQAAEPVQLYYCLPYLASFSSDFLSTPTMLAALPAHCLTQLNLHLKNNMPIDGPGIAAALAQLVNLQELLLGSSSINNSFPGSCLPAITHLTKLTSLKLRGYWSRTYQPLQQLLALPLPLPLQQLHLHFKCRSSSSQRSCQRSTWSA